MPEVLESYPTLTEIFEGFDMSPAKDFHKNQFDSKVLGAPLPAVVALE